MVVRLALSLDHGEIIVRPRPEPSSISNSVAAAAASAPAMIGPQLTAVADDSSGTEVATTETGVCIVVT